MKRHLGSIIYGIVLASFTIYLLLDTFVLPQAMLVVDGASSLTSSESSSKPSSKPSSDKASDSSSETESSESDSSESTSSATTSSESTGSTTSTVVTDSYYSDGSTTITITEYRVNDTSIYVADVQLSSATTLQTAFANNTYGKNITAKTSEIAEDNNAILAINGDYYGAQEKGYVIRNGVLYRSTAASDQQDLVIYEDGSFEIIDEADVTADELLSNGAYQVLSFGPALVENGTISVDENDEVGKSMVSNPRTAIAVVDDLHYLFIVSDGRTDESAGLTLYELAEFAQSLGATTAYNLDGGGSSAMYFNGEVVNNPTTNGIPNKDRRVSDIVFIGRT